MASPTIDRRLGLAGNTAFKAPVTVLAASNITLSGEQTIDGIAVLATNSAGRPDRVLCTGQTDATQNGIWDVSTAAWTRSVDANGNYDLAQGTTVAVTRGSTYAGTYWWITTTGSITIGTTSITWARALTSALSTLTFLQAGAGAVTRALLDKVREVQVSVKDYGATGDGVTDDTAAIQAAINYVQATTSNGPTCVVYFPPGAYISSRLTTAAGIAQFRGAGEYSSVIKLKAAANQTLFEIHAQCVATFDGLYLDGNKANQTAGTSHGIHFLPHTSYVLAGSIRNCQIVGFRTDGVKGSAFRNQLYIDTTDIRNNTNNGVTQDLDAVDWFLSNIEVGSNGQIGIDINGLAHIINFTSYLNGSSGVKFGSRLRHSVLFSGQIDQNQGNGLEVVVAAGLETNLLVCGVRFNDNSQGATNTYDHISLTDTDGVMIMGCAFLDSQLSPVSSVQPRYCVGIYGTSMNVQFLGCSTRTGAFLTDITNDFSKLGNGPQWGQQVFTTMQGSFQPLIVRRGGLAIQSTAPSNSATIGAIGIEGQDGRYGETRLGALMRGRMVGDWNNASTNYAPSEIVFGVQEASTVGTATADHFRMHPTNGFMIDNSAWNGRHFVMGVYHYWVDAFAMLRMQSSAPSTASSGFPFGSKVSVPTTVSSSGAPGQWAADTGFYYVYTGDGTAHSWRRAAVTTW